MKWNKIFRNRVLYIAVIVLIVLTVFLFYSKTVEGNRPNEEYDKVVFIIPSTSRNMNYKDVDSCSLLKILYNSLNDFDISKYTFLIGTDDDDEFYNNNIDALKSRLPKNFNFHVLNNYDKSYVCIVNQLADIAISDYDAKYIYVFADDLEVYDLDFIQNEFIPYFKANGNFGLGWGVDEDNIGLCTHPFVGRKHVELLGYFYPPSIKNWFCDNWIQNTYEELNKIVKTKDPVIRNAIGAGDAKRYDVSMIDDNKLKELVSKSVQMLERP
jgi:hypothetical protein